MSDLILQSNGNKDKDETNLSIGTTTRATKTNKQRHSGQPAEHQDAESWKKVGQKSVKNGFGSEKSTWSKLCLQVYMNLQNESNVMNTNVPHQQKLFRTELFKAVSSFTMLKWKEQGNQDGQYVEIYGIY